MQSVSDDDVWKRLPEKPRFERVIRGLEQQSEITSAHYSHVHANIV